jgi:hypothetical protein
MSEFSDEELLAELGVSIEPEPGASRTPREERIIAGFEDVERFFETHGRLPINDPEKDIFERLYAVRLERIRTLDECRAVVLGIDKHGLLSNNPLVSEQETGSDLGDEELLAELGLTGEEPDDVTKLTHVKTRAEIKAAEEVAKRAPCLDFDQFKPLFLAVQDDLKTGVRQSRRFKQDASIEKGEFFILSGQIAYVAEVGELMKASNGAPDARLRVIFDNGTESDLLLRSLQRALYKDEAGRRITDPSLGPLFSDYAEEGDAASGTIYVLRSKSDHPIVRENRDVIHKIGVTSGDIERRLANAKLDPTFLMADVEVIATYELSNINRVKLEGLIHQFFEPAKLEIEVNDRFGNPITPREWFLVPLFIIDEAIQRIRDGSIVNCSYSAKLGKITEI